VAAPALFGYAFFRLYLRPEPCAPGDACAVPAVRQRQRLILWIVAAALMSFALYAPLFY